MNTHSTLIKRPDGLLLRRTELQTERNWREDASYKFLFSPAGKVSYQTQKGDVNIHEGQFVVLNPQFSHRQVGFEREKLLIELSPRLIHEVAQAIGTQHHHDISFALQILKHPQLSQWVQFTTDYLALNDAKNRELFLDHALVQLVLLLLKSGVGSHSFDLQTSHLATVSPILNRAVDAMKQHHTNQWTLEEIALTVGMNKYQFAHLFKETMGVSPYSWLQLYRLVRSQELLKHSQYNILDIALATGFSSVTMFNQLFKRMYGVSPRAFRNRYK